MKSSLLKRWCQIDWRRWLVNGLKVLLVFLGVLVLMIATAVIFILNCDFKTLVLLQNTDEVRATGGFLGSIMLVEHRGLAIKNLASYDIYDLDQNLDWFLSAPPAVQAYLTGGVDELHLQDANWERDFPSSVKQIQTLLAQTEVPSTDFVVALNSSLFENFFARFGGLALNKQQGEVFLTAENFTYEARVDHSIFNPNRESKTIFLDNFAQTFLQEIIHAPLANKFQYLGFLWSQLQQREIQAYAVNPWYQQLFVWLGAAGQTRQSSNCHDLYQVPSNVGINKSNHLVTITTELKRGAGQQATLILTLQNDNPLREKVPVTERLHFADYQRLLLPPGVQVLEVTFNQETVTDLDWREVSDSLGNHWLEVGFLANVLEQTTGQVEIELQGERQCWHIH